ncbi:MAG TPA: capsule assembly Wzi family protein [Myxococcales bacterium]
MRFALLVAVACAFAASAAETDGPGWDAQAQWGAPGDGFWASPFQRLTLLGEVSGEHDRTYSTAVRTREIAGKIAISCEYQEGRPCGNGAFGGAELDSSAGYSRFFTAATRLRLSGGSALGADGFDLDRAYLRFNLDPLSLQIGRDVLSLGPSVRSALMLSTNAAPQDGIRVALQPVALPFAPSIRFSALYFIDRLRDPQRFPNALLDLLRFQLDFGDHFQFGASRSLQLGGDGAPDYGGFGDFILEHFRRLKPDASAENNRLSFDFTLRLNRLRAYYEIAFEDTSMQFLLNSLKYDADHLIGFELQKVGPMDRLYFEFEHTGYVSQEHSLFTTGMTNAGRTLGTALGPDGFSAWLRADTKVAAVRVSPWFEWLKFVSDRYKSSPVVVIQRGPQEHRQRLGLDVALPLAQQIRLEASLFGERIANQDFINGESSLRTGVRAALILTP